MSGLVWTFLGAVVESVMSELADKNLIYHYFLQWWKSKHMLLRKKVAQPSS